MTEPDETIGRPADDTPTLAVPLYLKGWRTYRGRTLGINLTQAALAEMVGVEPSSISQWENGGMGITDKSLAALARALDCSPAALLAFDPSRGDSFWPLFEQAERLEGEERGRVMRGFRFFLEQQAGGSV